MSHKLAATDVSQVALLSRITLTEEELGKYQESLTQILEYVSMLEEVDTTDVQPMAHAVEQHNCFREDEVQESFPLADALRNSPAQDGKYFLVPGAIESE